MLIEIISLFVNKSILKSIFPNLIFLSYSNSHKPFLSTKLFPTKSSSKKKDISLLASDLPETKTFPVGEYSTKSRVIFCSISSKFSISDLPLPFIVVLKTTGSFSESLSRKIRMVCSELYKTSFSKYLKYSFLIPCSSGNSLVHTHSPFASLVIFANFSSPSNKLII